MRVVVAIATAVERRTVKFRPLRIRNCMTCNFNTSIPQLIILHVTVRCYPSPKFTSQSRIRVLISDTRPRKICNRIIRHPTYLNINEDQKGDILTSPELSSRNTALSQVLTLTLFQVAGSVPRSTLAKAFPWDA